MKQRKFKFFTLTHIGKIKEVYDQPSWVSIQTEDGRLLSMKKIYATWRRQLQIAQELKEDGRPAVIRTGNSASAHDYFNYIFYDDEDHSILDVPDDAGPEATQTLIFERMQHQQHLSRAREQGELQITDLVGEIDRQRRAMEDQDRRNANLTRRSAGWLKDNWGSFQRQGRWVSVRGHARRVLALRCGLNLTDKNRILIKPTSLQKNTNYVEAFLPHHQIDVVLGIHRDKDNFYVATANMGIPDWFEHEREIAPNCAKDIDKPISWFLDKHQEIMNACYPPIVVEMGLQATVDVGAVVVKAS